MQFDDLLARSNATDAERAKLEKAWDAIEQAISPAQLSALRGSLGNGFERWAFDQSILRYARSWQRSCGSDRAHASRSDLTKGYAAKAASLAGKTSTLADNLRRAASALHDRTDGMNLAAYGAADAAKKAEAAIAELHVAIEKLGRAAETSMPKDGGRTTNAARENFAAHAVTLLFDCTDRDVREAVIGAVCEAVEGDIGDARGWLDELMGRSEVSLKC